MTPGETARSRFTGNTCFYVYAARHRGRVFLNRNVETVLRENEAARARSGNITSRVSGNSTPPTTDADSRIGSTFHVRQKVRLNQIISKLRPPIPTGRNEPVLKIETKSLKRKRLFKPRSNNSAQPIANGGGTNRNHGGSLNNLTSVRCKCELTIYEKLEAPEKRFTHNAKRDRDGVDKHELYRSSEICTITYDSDESATIEMDDHFYIKASKLFVLTNRGPIKSFGLAESYVAKVALQPIEIDGCWPPLLHREQSQGSERWLDPFSVELHCVFRSLPMSPPTAQHELSMTTDLIDDDRADLSLEVDCGWSDFRSISRSQWGEPYQLVTRLPTPALDFQRDSVSGHRALTCYFFMAPVDDERLHQYFGAPTARNQHLFTIPGYTCPFCDGREFQTLTFLHLHLITSHDLFHFKLKQKLPKNGLRSNDAHYDSLVEIHVDLSKEQVMSRPSDNVPDHRTFRWIKPNSRFNVGDMLKGDWSWLNEKKSTALSANYRREPGPPGTAVAPAPKKIDFHDLRPVPIRKRQKFIVPEAKNGVKGLVFVRNSSKRFIHPGEELSESDDEVDEDWLKRKHDETVHDFTDVATPERSFMVLWDRHVFDERPTGYAHIPQVLLRFSRANAEFLRNSILLVEFWKHCLNLVQYAVIDAECLRVCMDIVKGEHWSSFGKTELGIGLSGPIALDNSPTWRSAPARDDAMDIDHQGGPNTSTNKPRKPDGRDSGFCICGMPFDKPQMILCVGLNCQRRWFHNTCFSHDDLTLEGWLCPNCIEDEVNKTQ